MGGIIAPGGSEIYIGRSGPDDNVRIDGDFAFVVYGHDFAVGNDHRQRSEGGIADESQVVAIMADFTQGDLLCQVQCGMKLHRRYRLCWNVCLRRPGLMPLAPDGWLYLSYYG